MNPITEAALFDELEKISAAVSLSKKKGLGRLGELLTGSREKKLENRAKHLVERKDRVEDIATAAGKNLKKEPDEGAFDHWRRQRRVGSSTRSKVQDAIHDNRSELDRESKAVNKTRGRASLGTGIVAGGLMAANHRKKKKTDGEDAA
jgi:hypothetical protein